jgi:hypothetical protein
MRAEISPGPQCRVGSCRCSVSAFAGWATTRTTVRYGGVSALRSALHALAWTSTQSPTARSVNSF